MSSSKSKVADLIELGFAQIRAGDLDEALETAERLAAKRNTAHFEIGALAHLGMHDTQAALQRLEEGVEVAPDLWVLWQLMGNVLSDEGRYEEAGRAFERALACENVWPESVQLNQAILSMRQGENEEAIQRLIAITDEDLYFEVASPLVHAFHLADQSDKALELAREVMAREPLTASDQDAWYHLAIHAVRIRFDQGLPAEEARQETLALFRQDSTNEAALTLLRDIHNQRSKDCRYLEIMVEGTYHDESLADEQGVLPDGFYVQYEVVAENSEEAMPFIEEIEALQGYDSLVIQEVQVLAKHTGEPKGVYQYGSRHYFSE